jgi:hypothetical protein
MDITAIAVFDPELFRHSHKVGHCVVLTASDARGQEQPFDAVSAIEIERQLNHFINGKTRSQHIAGTTTDAIGAIVDAEVCQQDFQE